MDFSSARAENGRWDAGPMIIIFSRSSAQSALYEEDVVLGASAPSGLRAPLNDDRHDILVRERVVAAHGLPGELGAPPPHERGPEPFGEVGG